MEYNEDLGPQLHHLLASDGAHQRLSVSMIVSLQAHKVPGAGIPETAATLISGARKHGEQHCDPLRKLWKALSET